MSWKKSNIWNGSYLKKILESNRLAHAYIFLGGDKLKKLFTAYSLAKALYCKPDYCETCPSCAKVEHGSHPDIFILRPVGAMRLISIELVRNMQEFLSLKSFEGGKKIAIIIDAERMRPEAANAFLKTLEEPPGNTIIILIAEDVERILPTILSRCQDIHFPLSSKESICDYLVNEEKLGHQDAGLIASISNGSLENAVKYMDEGRRRFRDYIVDSIVGLLSTDNNYILDSVETEKKINELVKQSIKELNEKDSGSEEEMDEMEKKAVEKNYQQEEVSGFLKIMESCFRDILVFQETKNKELIINVDKFNQISKMNYILDSRKINDIFTEIQKAYDGFKGNTNLQFVLDILFERVQAAVLS